MTSYREKYKALKYLSKLRAIEADKSSKMALSKDEVLINSSKTNNTPGVDKANVVPVSHDKPSKHA